MILAVSQQFAGLAIIGTYSSCKFREINLHMRAHSTDFFSLAGLADPFLGSLIIS
jgi:hypothetical protein